MTDYHWFVIGHLLCFVYWLGGDLGVYYSSRFVVDSTLSTDARRVAAKIMEFLDYFPRLCLVLILPFGVTLAAKLGLIPLATGGLLSVWAVSLIWAAVVTVVYFAHGGSWLKALRMLDWVLRWSAIAILVWLGYAAFTGTAGVAPARWLALKCLIFATVIFSGVCLRLVTKGLGGPFAAVMQGKATAEDNETVRRTIALARPFVFYIWFGVFVVAVFGVAKPSL